MRGGPAHRYNSRTERMLNRGGGVFSSVLLCYDGSAAGRRALKRGAELAMLVKARVHLLSILSTAADPLMAANSVGQICLVNQEAEHRQSLEESLEWLRARGVEASGYLAKGDTIEQITAYAQKLGVDLVVVGHYPKPSGGRWWSGAERSALAERVSCCILIAVSDSDAAPAA
jgi:nucleotide-binding universal stress UspA family protein